MNYLASILIGVASLSFGLTAAVHPNAPAPKAAANCCVRGLDCCNPPQACCVADCCALGLDCCYPGSPCCGDCCTHGQDCCFPPQDCCTGGGCCVPPASAVMK